MVEDPRKKNEGRGKETLWEEGTQLPSRSAQSEQGHIGRDGLRSATVARGKGRRDKDGGRRAKNVDKETEKGEGCIQQERVGKSKGRERSVDRKSVV